MKKIFVFLLLLCAHAAYCWNFSNLFCYDEGLGTGFYVGGNGSFGNIDFQLEEELFQDRTGVDELNFFDSDTFQIAEGGGLFFGYGIRFCDRYRLALQFDANWYGNEAKHSFNFADVGKNWISKLRCENLYDLSLRPGVMIGDCLLFNFQVGASWAGICHTSLIIEDDVPNPLLDKSTKCYHRTGYVLGAGAQIALTCKLSAIAEYNWHRISVSKSNKTSTSEGLGGTVVSNTSELARLSASLIKFGLAYRI